MGPYLFTFLASVCLAVTPMKPAPVPVKAIILLGDSSLVLDRSAREEVKGIWVEGVDLPGNEQLLEAMLGPVLQSPLNKKALEYIEDKIFEYYRELGISNIHITIPESAIEDGVVQLVIEQREEKSQNLVRGIVLVSDPKDLIYHSGLSQMEGIWIKEELEDEAGIEQLLTPLLEKEFTEETLFELQEKLSQYYEGKNSKIVVTVPIQKKETGVIQIVAQEPVPEPKIPKLRAIVLLSEEDELLSEEELQALEGVWANLPTLPGDEDALHALLQDAIGVELNSQALQYIEAKILNHYRDANRTDIQIFIPEQEKETEVVQIRIKQELSPRFIEEEPATEIAVVEEIAEEPAAVEEVAACEIPEPVPEAPLPKVKGIVLLSGSDSLLDQETLNGIEGILVSGFKIPGNECLLEKTLESLLQEPFNENTLNLIQEQIYEYYRASDRPFVLVDVPDQKEETGVAQIVIQESTLGKISVVGNQWTHQKRYENYFRMKPGDPISQRRLNRDVDFMNRNPYRFVNVIYSPGEKEYTTDLTLEVADRKPYFFYAGLDNTGVPTTGRARVFAGFSWDQMFGLDQLFFYQYSTNYSSQKYHSNSFQYMAMLPWEAILNIFGGFSIMHADLHPAPAHNKGTNIQASIRYVTPFAPKAHFSQEIIAGFDIKNTNNTIEFTDTDPIVGHDINMTQWLLSYKCKYEWKKIEVEGGVEGVFSPFAWLPNQTDADFASLRPYATNTWFYATGYCNIRRALPHAFSTVIRMNGQYSPSTLLPSEQIGLGGHASVRGYDERQYNGDSGFILNWEVHSPHFSFFRSKKRSLTNDAYFLAFFDGGCGFDNTHIPHVQNANFLSGIGAGFRYYLGTYLNARFDYGIKLHHQADFTGGQIGHAHFSVSGSY